MPINKNSRYWKTPKYTAKTSDNKEFTAFQIRLPTTSEKFTEHTVKQSDRLDLVSNTFYKNPTKFWLICDNNNAYFPLSIMQNGKKLSIPKQTF